MRELTGFAIGGVAPLGSLTPLPTFMDADLMAFDVVWAAAGAPTAVFAVEPAALAAATGAEIIRVSLALSGARERDARRRQFVRMIRVFPGPCACTRL